MKNVFIAILLLASFGLKAQQPPATGSSEQQEQFRKQMEDFKLQMQAQMQSLKDSLQKMSESMQRQGYGSIDTSVFKEPFIPPVPDIPPVPPAPPAPLPPGVSVDAGDTSTEVRVGKWNIVVHDGDDGEDHVNVYKNEEEEYDQDLPSDERMRNVKTKFLQLDLGLNNYFASGLSSKFPSGYSSFNPIPGSSWVVNIHAVDQQLNLISHHLWLAYGAYFELNSYKFNNDDVVIPKIDSLAFAASDVPLDKNKLSCEYVGVPLMLRYESNPHNDGKSFHLSAGMFGEYLLGAHTKTKNTSGDKNKVHDDFNLNRFRYGITARAGYGWINVFANVSMSELLVNGAGPQLFPVSAGLAFEF